MSVKAGQFKFYIYGYDQSDYEEREQKMRLRQSLRKQVLFSMLDNVARLGVGIHE